MSESVSQRSADLEMLAHLKIKKITLIQDPPHPCCFVPYVCLCVDFYVSRVSRWLGDLDLDEDAALIVIYALFMSYYTS